MNLIYAIVLFVLCFVGIAGLKLLYLAYQAERENKSEWFGRFLIITVGICAVFGIGISFRVGMDCLQNKTDKYETKSNTTTISPKP